MSAASDDPTFWIGRSPTTSSRLPYLLRLPVSGEGRVFLAARETWQRGTDVFCHQLAEWPVEAEVIEEVPVEACWRVGAAVHLVLRRARQRRSLFVWTRKGERTLVFWRSEASMRRARPGIRVPLARDFGEPLPRSGHTAGSPRRREPTARPPCRFSTSALWVRRRSLTREPRLLDATARRSSLLEEAIAGAEWTSRSAARRCGVTQVTAAADLAALVREGRLRVTGAGTKRRYVARLP